MKAAVLGLGDSLKNFNASDFDLSIGVNDIWRHVKTDVVVCLDYPNIFPFDRLKVINECKPKAFYSQIVKWDTRPDFVKINLTDDYPNNICNLDLPKYYKSYCSPFVAVQIAWKVYFADEIHLYGVDLLNHPHLDQALCAKIKLHFRNLKTALTQKGCDLIVYGSGILKDI
jgi:hypothetical protein